MAQSPAPATATLQAVEALTAPSSAGGCLELVVRADRGSATATAAAGGIFADGFESGDLSAWTAPSGIRATAIVDLLVEAALPAGWSGDAQLEVSLSTPNGTLYETRTLALSSTAQSASERRVAGFPHPLSVTRTSAGEIPTARFPVAGTTIVASGLYGEWTANATLVDPANGPCWSSRSFELQP